MSKRSIPFPPRLENETEKSYLAFVLYCSLGPSERSINAAYDVYRARANSGSSATRWREWSSKYNWQERTLDYDRLWAEAIADGIRAEVRNKLTEKVLKQFTAFETIFNALNGAMTVITTKSVAIARLPIDESDIKDGEPVPKKNGKPVLMKDRKEAIGMLKDLSVTLKNTGDLARNLHQSWAELNGIAELKDRLDKLET